VSLLLSNVTKSYLISQGVVAGLLVQNTLKLLLGFGQVSPYLVSAGLVLPLFSFPELLQMVHHILKIK